MHSKSHSPSRKSARSKSPNSTRSLLNQMTIAQLRALAKKHKVSLSNTATKTGIGSRLMRKLSSEQIKQAGTKKLKLSKSKSPSRAKKPVKRSASPCPKSRMVHRKAYTRADGTKVKAVTYCRKN